MLATEGNLPIPFSRRNTQNDLIRSVLDLTKHGAWKKMREKIPYDEMYLENVNLTEDKQEDFEQQVDLEDFLYETWKENQIHNQNDTPGIVDTPDK